jgi:hypothetical protein
LAGAGATICAGLAAAGFAIAFALMGLAGTRALGATFAATFDLALIGGLFAIESKSMVDVATHSIQILSKRKIHCAVQHNHTTLHVFGRKL